MELQAGQLYLFAWEGHEANHPKAASSHRENKSMIGSNQCGIHQIITQVAFCGEVIGGEMTARANEWILYTLALERPSALSPLGP